MSDTESRPSPRRRRLGALLLLAVLALLVSRLPSLTALVIEHGLSRFFRRAVTVEAVRFHAMPVQAEVVGLRVAGATPDALPFLSVPRIVAVPRLAQLLGRRLDLAELRLEQPSIRINAFPEGGDDIPRMGGGGGGGFELRIDRLAIRDGEFVLDHRRVPLDLELPDFRGGLVRRAGPLAGRLSFGPGRMRFGEAAPFPIGVDLELEIRGSLLDVSNGRIWTDRMELACDGEIELARRPKGSFGLYGRVDLDELDRHVMRTGFDIKGVGDWIGGFAFEGSQLEIVGDVKGRDGEFDGVPVPRYSAHVEWRDGGVRFSELDVETLDGTGTLEIDLPGQNRERRMRGEMRAVDAEGLTMLLFDVGPFGFSGRATGPFDVRWRRDRFRELSGFVTTDVEARPDGRRVPLQGRLEWRAESGVQQIDRSSFASPTTTLEMSGSIQLDRRADLSLDVTSRDVAATDLELRGIRRALGTADALRFGLAGTGHFRGRWHGTLSEPVFTGRLDAPRIAYLGVDWGAGDWTGTVSLQEVDTRVLRLERDAGVLSMTGRVATGYWGEGDGVDLEARFLSWPAEDFVTAFAWDLELTGRVTGEARVRGRRSAPEGFVQVREGEGLYYGIPFDELEAESLLGGFDFAISRGRARVGGGELSFRGTLTDTGLWDGALEGRDVELEQLGLPAAIAGRVAGEATLQGTLERPRGLARLTATDVRLEGAPVGAITASLHAPGDGRVTLRALAPEGNLSLAGSAESAAPYEGELRLEATGTRLDPYARSLGARLPQDAQLVATGELRVTGPLGVPEQLRGEAALSELRVEIPDYPMRNRAPVAIRLDRGTVSIDSFALAGEGTDLEVGGRAHVADGSLAVVVEGLADLGFVTGVDPRLRARGTARLATLVGGTLREPSLQGSLELDGIALRLRGIPHGLEGVRGRIDFTESIAQFQELTGTLGGGEVETDGQVTYGPEGLGSLEIEARGRRMTLQYPEGLRSLLDAELRVFGDAEQQWVTGSVNVRRAEWTRRYDLTAELLAGAQTWQAEPSLQESVSLDVRVRAPGTLKIDNNLATLFASADLHLQGTAAAPVLVGRAETDRGRVYFQGNTYVIRHGTIDFANPRRTEPLFDVEAETRVRSYRVALRLNGTLERVVPTLTSDPPLSPIQILNLLAGADESAVASLAQAQAEQARLAAAGAATLAAGRINEEVGLERGAERLLGLNRFSIDPSVLKGDFQNPTARLTLGKRIGPDLNVQYSQDLSAAADRLFTLEYNLSDRLSLLVTQAEPGGFGFDLRLRQTR
jgi:autotransporter translocation and assembly factor TamB